MSEVVVPIVLDTNELVPTLYRGLKSNIFRFIIQGNIVLIWNDFIRDEAIEIIERLEPEYCSKYGVTKEELFEILDLILIEEYKVPEMPEYWKKITMDRDDDNFLFAAYAGGAEYVVSADGHMLTVKKYKGIPIGRPKQFFLWVKVVHPMKISNPT